MTTLRKPTQSYRVTIKASGGLVCPPEDGAPRGAVRRVQIGMPDSPQIALMVDVRPEQIASRVYRGPEPPMGRFLTLHLLPHQHLSAIATEGFAELSVYVEYLG